MRRTRHAPTPRRGLATALLLASMLLLTIAPGLAHAQEKAGEAADSRHLKRARDEVKKLPEDELFRLSRDDEEAARDEGDSQLARQRRKEKKLELMSRAEQEKAGFVFRAPARKSQRSSAVLMALFPGLVVHGAGHLYMKNNRTGFGLLIMEGLGVAMAASGALIPLLFEDEPASMALSRPLMYVGTGIFASSYILDVLGAIQGPELQFTENNRKLKGGSMGLRYTFMSSGLFPLRNLLTLDMEGQTKNLAIKLQTDQDVQITTGTSIYRVELGGRLRPWSDDTPQSYLFGQADGEYMSFRGVGRFDRLSVGGQLGISYDLGGLSSHLRGVVLGGQAGYQYQRLAFPVPTRDPRTDPPETEWQTATSSIPVKLWMHFNFNERLSFNFAYTRRDGDLLNGMRRLLAVPSAGLIYKSTETIDLEMNAAYGDGLGLSAGLRAWFF